MRTKFFFLFFVLSTLFSCEEQEENKLNILKYNQSSGITSLDPAFAKNQANIWAVSQLFNGLVQLDDNLQIAPCIAKSWKFSDNGKSINFILRDDVYFKDSIIFEEGRRKVVANDFVYSFSRIVDPKTASPGAWIFNNKISDGNAFVAIDDTIFQINLKESFSPILGILAMPYCFVVPKEAIDYYGQEFRANPVGTGPFKLKVWEEGTALVALRNDDYFEKDSMGERLPYVDGFKVSFTESKKMEYLHFMKGNIDLLSGVDKTFVETLFDDNASLKPEWESKMKLYKAPFLNMEYLGFNLTSSNKWIKNKAFRQAINYCFDREIMIRYLRKGMGQAAENGFIPKGLPSYNNVEKIGYTYDKYKADSLLKEINYDGEILKLSTNETYKDIALFIANEAEKVGVNIEVEVVQPSLLREWMVQGQVDFFRGSWIADYPDGENYLSLFYGANSAPPNYTHFKNTIFDSLYNEASIESDLEDRIKLYQGMDSIIIEEAPVVFLYYDEIIRLTQTNISGAKPNPLNLLDIKHIKKEE